MEHPLNHELEALLVGEASPETAAHVDACDTCQDYLRELRAEETVWRAGDSRQRFAARLAEASSTPAVSKLVVLRRFTTVAAPVLAAAAVLLLVLQLGEDPSAGGPGSGVASCATCNPSPGDTRFKGDTPQIFVIVQNSGVQTRSASEAQISDGSQLRVEVGLTRTQPIAAGVLTRDRKYVPLILPAELDQGTHYSEKAVGFDAEPTDGWVVVGTPDAVHRAEKTGSLTGVTAIPLRYNRTP